MKKMLRSIGIAAFVAVIGFGFVACEGPAGLQGARGDEGRAASAVAFDVPTIQLSRAEFAEFGLTIGFEGFIGTVPVYSMFDLNPINNLVGLLEIDAPAAIEGTVGWADVARTGMIEGSITLEPSNTFPPTLTAPVTYQVSVTFAGLTARLNVVVTPAYFSGFTVGDATATRGETPVTTGVSTTNVAADNAITITVGETTGTIGAANLNGLILSVPVTTSWLAEQYWRLANTSVPFEQLLVSDVDPIGDPVVPVVGIGGNLVLGPYGTTATAADAPRLILTFANGIGATHDNIVLDFGFFTVTIITATP